jgi:hypothetical protein
LQKEIIQYLKIYMLKKEKRRKTKLVSYLPQVQDLPCVAPQLA